MDKEYELIKFEEGGFRLDVNVRKDDNSVWLSAMEMSTLFEKNYKTISNTINNIFAENGLEKGSKSRKMRFTGNDKPTTYYGLDIIVLVGNKIKSKRAEIFKQWAERLQNDENHNLALTEPIIRFEYENLSLDVTVSPEENTVWLTQAQICELFDTSKQNISYHIQNIYDEKELEERATVKYYLTVQNEGNREITRSIKAYNLDMIISVGFRVNSKRGIAFRRWANSVLKQYLLKGYAVNNDRILAYQSNILNLEANVLNIENRIKNLEMTIYADNSQIIFEG